METLKIILRYWRTILHRSLSEVLKALSMKGQAIQGCIGIVIWLAIAIFVGLNLIPNGVASSGNYTG